MESDQPIGEYVFGSTYRLMRLRMLLTGTASPTEEQWTEALGELLLFMEQSGDAQFFLNSLEENR